MKIVHLTPIQLTLQHRPVLVWIIGGVFFIVGILYLLLGCTQLLIRGIDFQISMIIVSGIVCIVAMSLVVVYYGKLIVCHFNKTTEQFTLTRSLPGSSQANQYPLQEIVGVCLQGHYQSDKRLYYLCLILDKGIFVQLNAYARPLSSGGSNFVEGQAAASCICAFLNFDSAPVMEALCDQSSPLIWQVAFARKKKVEAEIDRLQQVIDQDPGNVNARYSMILVLQMQQRIKEARTFFEQSKVTLLERREFLKCAQLNEEFQKYPHFY